MASSLLGPILSNEVPSSNGQFVVITDSLVQPGLSLLTETINRSLARNEPVVLISLEQTPSRLVRSPLPEGLTLLDGVSCPPFASTSTLAPHFVDWLAPGGLNQLQGRVEDAVTAALGTSLRVTVVLDSVTRLAEEGAHEAAKLIRAVLAKIKSHSGSRLVTLHHHNYPTAPSGQSHPALLQPDLLPLLLSPSLSPTTIHFTLHPVPLLSLLSRHYGLAVPLPPSTATPLDLRLTSFLASFAKREWGSPLVLPAALGDEDERVGVDGLVVGGKGCVVEWEARGLSGEVEKVAVAKGADKGKQAEGRRVIQRGMEGFRKKSNGDGVEAVGLEEIMRGEVMTIAAAPSAPTTPAPQPTNAPPSSSFKPSAPPPPAAPASTDPSSLLPFNLALTDAQKAAREAVVLPYLPKELGGYGDKDRAIYGEQGHVPTYNGPTGGGGVVYTPDEGDDMDEDDPDEDLEV